MPAKRIKNSSKVGLIILINILVLFFLAIAFGREYVGNMQIEREIAQLESQRSELEQDKLTTQTLIDQLSNEYFLEKEGRLKHGLGRNGESVIIVQAAENPTAENQTDNSALFLTDGISNPQRWYYYFFDKDLFGQLQQL